MKQKLNYTRLVHKPPKIYRIHKKIPITFEKGIKISTFTITVVLSIISILLMIYLKLNILIFLVPLGVGFILEYVKTDGKSIIRYCIDYLYWKIKTSKKIYSYDKEVKYKKEIIKFK